MSGYQEPKLAPLYAGALDVAMRELRLNGDAGSPAATDRAVWWHHCPVERDMLATGKGEPCSWCDREEPKP